MPENVDWERRGYIDYPRSDMYPHRDQFSAETETRYLTGWHKRRRSEEQENVINSMGTGEND